MALLSQCAIALEGHPMPLSRFAQLFDAVLSSQEIGTIPQGLDEIPLAALTECVHPLRASFFYWVQTKGNFHVPRLQRRFFGCGAPQAHRAWPGDDGSIRPAGRRGASARLSIAVRRAGAALCLPYAVEWRRRLPNRFRHRVRAQSAISTLYPLRCGRRGCACPRGGRIARLFYSPPPDGERAIRSPPRSSAILPLARIMPAGLPGLAAPPAIRLRVLKTPKIPVGYLAISFISPLPVWRYIINAGFNIFCRYGLNARPRKIAKLDL